MKKTDIAMIILISGISILLAYFVGRTVLGDGHNTAVKVKTAPAITTRVKTPDAAVFNKSAINPTVQVIIGGDGQPQGIN